MIDAVNHRKNARLTGGICSFISLATIKFPDQIKTARKARLIPVIESFFDNGVLVMSEIGFKLSLYSFNRRIKITKFQIGKFFPERF